VRKLFTIVGPYQASLNKKAITVLTTPTTKGWLMQVQFPERVSGADKLKLLNWVTVYREKIRKEKPNWDVSFRTSPNAYVLTINPKDGDADLKQLASERSSALFDSIVSSYVG
jgi:hypothetical protein